MITSNILFSSDKTTAISGQILLLLDLAILSTYLAVLNSPKKPSVQNGLGQILIIIDVFNQHAGQEKAFQNSIS